MAPSAREGRQLAAIIVALLALFPLLSADSESLPPPPSGERGSATIDAEKRTLESFDHLGDYFIENRGQVNELVRYYSTGNPSVAFRDDGMMFVLREKTQVEDTNWRRPADLFTSRETEQAVVKSQAFLLRFEGANKVTPVGRGRLGFDSNFFVGNDPTAWKTDVMNFGEVEYEDLYDGIDLVYRATAEGVKYEYRIAPGANPESIRVSYEGIDLLGIEEGSLVVHMALGSIHDSPPVSNQGGREIHCDFTILDPRSQGFECEARDPSEILVIDPLVYGTFLGGAGGGESGYSIVVDSGGNAYVAGPAKSWDFPVTPGAYDELIGGTEDAFVAKVNEVGSSLTFATFLGGSEVDFAEAIAVDAQGDCYVTGFTDSSDFPTVSSFDETYNGARDVFAARLSALGDQLLYSTYLGGNNLDEAFAITVAPWGSVFITGRTSSDDFPITTWTIDSELDGLYDAFMVRLSPQGYVVEYSTFLGGSGDERADSLVFVLPGNVWVVGTTTSDDFPTPGGADKTFASYEGFVAKLDLGARTVVYGTYLGGSAYDTCEGLALDLDGNVYVIGTTSSPDLPSAPNLLSGSLDAFVAKLNPTISTILYSRYLGGSDWEVGHTLAVDSSGAAYLTGVTASSDFPTTPDALNKTHGGSGDVYYTRVDPSGTFLQFSTFMGGTAYDQGESIALDSAGNAYVTGNTMSAEFPVTPGAIDTTYNGGEDAFVVKISPQTPPILPDLTLNPPDISFNPPGPIDMATNVRITAIIHNIGAHDASQVPVRFYDGPPAARDPIDSDQIITYIAASGGMGTVMVNWSAGPPGTHAICVAADPNGLILEENETNNVACESYDVNAWPLPDLTISSSDLSVLPSSPMMNGTSVLMNATVRNVGNATSAATTVRFYDGIPPSVQIGIDQPLAALSENASEMVSMTWIAYPPGMHDICAVADPDNIVFELSERNNTACTRVEVLRPLEARPDYVPVSPYPLPPIFMGMSMPVSLSIQVLNQGNDTAAADATVAFSEQPAPPFRTFVLVPLAPANTSIMFTATWFSPATPGTYVIVADVDHYDNVTEWDETNNLYEWTVEVGADINTTLVVGTPNYTALHVFVNSLTPLSFSAISHTGSSIAYTEYRIDDGNWTDYSTPFTLAGDGAHLIDYRSADILGRLEMTRSSFLVVDNTPPPSHLHVGQPSYTAGDTWITSDTPLTIDASESITSNASYVSSWHNLTVFEDWYDINETFIEYLAQVNLTVTRDIWPGLRSATFHIWSPNCNDIDLGVFLDANRDGLRQVTEFQGLGGGPTSEEKVVLYTPLPGTYIIAIAGYDVPWSQGCLVNLEVAQDVGGSASVGYEGVTFRYFAQGTWSPWANYSGEFKIQGEGHAHVEHSSYDILGNYELAQNDTLHIDNTPPVSTLTIGSPNYTVGGNFISFSTNLTLQATDAGATPVGIGEILYSIDGRAWYPYSSPLSFMNEGPHTVEYRTRDRLMNTETAKSMDVIVDATPPTTFCTTGLPRHSSDRLYIRSLTPYNLTSIDGGLIPVGTEAVRYRIDGGLWSDYQSNFTIVAGDGVHVLEYTSWDRLGNQETMRNITFFLDNAPPVSTLEPSGEDFTTETLFVLNVTDSGSGVRVAEYRVDGGGWVRYPGDFTLSEGVHNISYRSRDNLDNTEQERWRVVTIHGAPPPPSVEANYKPIVALVFAIILAVVGIWSSKKRPWKGGNDRMAVAKAFIVTTAPFVLAEALTGIFSLTTGQLSIPPLIEVGMLLDAVILVMGLTVLIARAVRKGRAEEKTPDTAIED